MRVIVPVQVAVPVGMHILFPVVYMGVGVLMGVLVGVHQIAVAVFMGALTLLLLYAGGYDALSECMVVIAFPVAIVLLLVCASVFKFLFHREEYDVTYQEELAEQAAAEQAEFDARVEAAARKLMDG